MSVTTPAHGAVIAVSIFIALMTISVSPTSTVAPASTGSSTTAPAIGVSTPSSPLGTVKPADAGCAPDRANRGFAAAQRRRLLFEQRQRARAGCLRADRRGEVGMFGEKRRASIARAHHRMRQDRAQLLEIRRQAADVELVERAQSMVERRRE